MKRSESRAYFILHSIKIISQFEISPGKQVSGGEEIRKGVLHTADSIT